MSKFLLDYDTKRNQDERVPAILKQLASAGKLEMRQVILVEVSGELAQGVRIILGALGIESEEFADAPAVIPASVDWAVPGSEKPMTISIPPKTVREPADQVQSRETPLQSRDTSLQSRDTSLQSRDTWPVCPNCKERFWAKRKDQTYCLKAECKKAKAREYAKAHAKKNGNSVSSPLQSAESVDLIGEAAGEVPFGSQEENGTP